MLDERFQHGARSLARMCNKHGRAFLRHYLVRSVRDPRLRKGLVFVPISESVISRVSWLTSFVEMGRIRG